MGKVIDVGIKTGQFEASEEAARQRRQRPADSGESKSAATARIASRLEPVDPDNDRIMVRRLGPNISIAEAALNTLPDQWRVTQLLHAEGEFIAMIERV